MPPKQRITREMILETSFSMFCREGMEAVNARSVAKALNCSTQPIFSYYSGMEDLKNALEERAKTAFEAELSAAAASEKPLTACCQAYFRFAMKEPNLFRQLCLNKQKPQQNGVLPIGQALYDQIGAKIAEQPGMDAERAKQLCFDLWVYAHGLSALQAMDLLDLQPEKAEALIDSAYDRFRQ